MGSMLLRHSRRSLPTPSILHTGGNGADSHVKWVGRDGSSRQIFPATRILPYVLLGPRHQSAQQRQSAQYHFLKLASTNWFHRRYRDLLIPTASRLTLLLQGIKRLSSPKQKKQPITMPFLRLLYRNLNFARPQQRLLWGIILIGYFFMLRRSEYLMVEQARHFNCLKNSNAFFSDKEGKQGKYAFATSITIGLAKNDQYGRGAWRTMLTLLSVQSVACTTSREPAGSYRFDQILIYVAASAQKRSREPSNRQQDELASII
ncbi:hypothetical protein GQ600_12572 [Phytophthora cactorum]|nr:hypothetical protein GQ600_12572 [Phytophthora cactorum]